MAGVHDLSNYQTQTERRMRNTFGYVQVTTFGSTDAATALIGRVRRMHERVNGTMPDGRPYRAMDPELIGWVHNAIPWSIMLAYEAYVRPLTDDEKNRYLSEQAVIGRMGGAGDIPTSVDGARRVPRADAPEAGGHRADARLRQLRAGPARQRAARGDAGAGQPCARR